LHRGRFLNVRGEGLVLAVQVVKAVTILWQLLARLVRVQLLLLVATLANIVRELGLRPSLGESHDASSSSSAHL